MKKKTKQMKKQKKRKFKKSDRGIVDLIMIKNHFFHNFDKWISEMTDPRDQSYITYTQEDLIYLGLMKNMCA